MKKLLLLFLSTLFVGGIFSQSSYEVTQNGSKIESGTPITITHGEKNNFGSEQDPIYVISLESLVGFRNTTSGSIDLTIEQTVLETPENTPAEKGFSFCYAGTCEVKWINMSKTQNILAGGTSDGFHLSYEPEMDVYGTAKVQYEFYIGEKDPEDPNYFIVTITYIYSESSITSIKDNAIRDISLYQSGSMVNLVYEFDYSAERTFSAYSITGEKIGEYGLNGVSGTFQLPQHLNKGLYIFTINENNKPLATRKMMIQ